MCSWSVRAFGIGAWRGLALRVASAPTVTGGCPAIQNISDAIGAAAFVSCWGMVPSATPAPPPAASSSTAGLPVAVGYFCRDLCDGVKIGWRMLVAPLKSCMRRLIGARACLIRCLAASILCLILTIKEAVGKIAYEP